MATKHYKDEKDQRLYHIEGLKEDLPSVTTILTLLDDGKSGALMGWSVKVMAEYLKSLADPRGHIVITKEETDGIFKKAKAYYKQLKQEAADIGSEIHNLIEVHLKGQSVQGLIEANPKLQKPFDAFLAWQKEYDFKSLKTEHIIWSKKYRFAGTLDIFGKLKNKNYIIDTKSSTAIRNEYILQIAAYRQGFEEMENILVDGVAILRLDKLTGIPEFKEYTLEECNKAFMQFLCLCKLWHLRNSEKDINGKN